MSGKKGQEFSGNEQRKRIKKSIRFCGPFTSFLLANGSALVERGRRTKNSYGRRRRLRPIENKQYRTTSLLFAPKTTGKKAQKDASAKRDLFFDSKTNPKQKIYGLWLEFGPYFTVLLDYVRIENVEYIATQQTTNEKLHRGKHWI